MINEKNIKKQVKINCQDKDKIDMIFWYQDEFCNYTS